MAPARSRSSRAPRPSASQGTSRRPEAAGVLARQMRSDVPAYAAPENQLTHNSLQRITQLRTKYERKHLDQKYKRGIGNLGECIYDLNRRLAESEERLEKEEQKGDEGNEERLETLRSDLEDLRRKMERLPGRMEKHARLCVDLEERWRVLLAGVDASVEAAATARGPTAGMAGRARRTTTQRSGATTGSGMESSFEPTMPGATADDGEGGDADGDEDAPIPVSVLEKFQALQQAELDRWSSLPLLNRYGHNDLYKEYKAHEHEGTYGDEAEAPHPTRWFEAEEPQPGTATQGAAEESDDDIQVAKTKISTKCPLTLREFKDPVKSSTCGHTFEKNAILEMMGRSGQAKQCPVPGCPHRISRSQLTGDDTIIRKIKRIQQARNRAQQQQDNHRLRNGQDADTSILLSSVADGFEDVDATPKEERITQTQRGDRNVMAGRGSDAMDVDDEDQEGDDTEDEDF